MWRDKARGTGTMAGAAFFLLIAALASQPVILFAAASDADPAGRPSSAEPTAPPAVSPRVTMEPVVVTATRIPSAVEQVPAAVTVLDAQEIRKGRPAATMEDVLRGVPGVFVQNRFNFAQDLRISIRGFGARSAFGIRGIQIYVDGIPQTLADGQSQVDDIDPETIARVEVLRGPVSALYGNASGGVIHITTKNGTAVPSVEAQTVLGEYGLRKTAVQGGGQSGRINYFLNASYLQADGFRDHAMAESSKINGKMRFEPDEASELTLLANAVYSPELQDPGGLTRAQADADPRQAAPLSLRFDTREEIANSRLGLVYRRALTPSQNVEAAAYYSRRDLDNAIPYRFIELARELFGGRVQYDISGAVAGFAQQFFFGLETQFQMDDRRNFDNVDGNAGNMLLLDQDEDVTSFGVFLQENFKLNEKWSLLAGGRYDQVRFEVDDHLGADGDDSGSRTFDQATGRFGAIYALQTNMHLYANVAQSFETPTTTEIVNRPEGGGGINPDIAPQRAVNYEVGLKGNLGDRLTYEAAVFYIQLEDELIAFRDFTDRVYYRNAGESHRIGAEFGVTVALAQGLRTRFSYTYLEAEFDHYLKNGVDLAGNTVPGLPRHELFGELLYEHPGGAFMGIDIFYAADFFVDDENSLQSSAYALVNLRAGYRKQLGRWLIMPFLGIENLFDETYNGNVRINANGGRYFEPAPGVNAYAGLRFGYQW